MEEDEPKEAVRWRGQVGGDGDEVMRGSNPETGGSRRTSDKTRRVYRQGMLRNEVG